MSRYPQRMRTDGGCRNQKRKQNVWGESEGGVMKQLGTGRLIRHLPVLISNMLSRVPIALNLNTTFIGRKNYKILQGKGKC